MEHRAEISRFALFLFCLLVPLGSSAPTEMTTTTGQRQKHFPTEPQLLASLIEKRATTLFESYKKCISPTLWDNTWLHDTSEERDLAERIPDCPAFRANCCALHGVYGALRALQSDIRALCGPGAHDALEANMAQLRDTLSEGAAFYTCQDLPQARPPSLAHTKTRIWWVLQKYKRVMQNTRQLYSEAAA